MEKVYLMNQVALFRKIKETTSVNKIYDFDKNDGIANKKYRIFIRSKAIILEYSIQATHEGSKLFLSAMSPFCLISTTCEEMWINKFLHDLDLFCETKLKKPFLSPKIIRAINYVIFGHPRL